MLNLISLNKTGYLKMEKAVYVAGPVVSGLSMGIFVRVLYMLTEKVMPDSLATLFSILLAAIFYIGMIFMTKSISTDELGMLPGGRRINKWLKKKGSNE